MRIQRAKNDFFELYRKKKKHSHKFKQNQNCNEMINFLMLQKRADFFEICQFLSRIYKKNLIV